MESPFLIIHEPGRIRSGVREWAGSGPLQVRAEVIAALFLLTAAMYVDRDIVDQTGLAGAFDLHLDLSLPDLQSGVNEPDPASPLANGNAAQIAAALRKLGLALHNGKRPAAFLAIDHVERPSAN